MLKILKLFGLSEDPGGDSCAELVALALAQNYLPERYVVMGHSFACSIVLEAAHMAARQASRSLAMANDLACGCFGMDIAHLVDLWGASWVH